MSTDRKILRRSASSTTPWCGNHALVTAAEAGVLLTQTRGLSALRYLTAVRRAHHVAEVEASAGRSTQYGGNDHGTRSETLAGCLRSGDGLGWWVSFDLSSRQRNSAPAAVLGSLSRCVPVRDHLKRIGTLRVWRAPDTWPAGAIPVAGAVPRVRSSGCSRARSVVPGIASGALWVSGQIAGAEAELAALIRDLPRFRLLFTGTWNRARADVAPQDCSALAAWFGIGEQVKHRMG